MTPFTVALYTPDIWESVCPVLRVIGPVEQAGGRVVCGASLAPTGALATFSLEPIATADVVVIQRDFPRFEVPYGQVIAAARQQQRPIIYETDDLLWNLPLTHPLWEFFASKRLTLLRAMLQADAVTVSTAPLAEALRALHPNVQHLPNCLNEALWPLRPPRVPDPQQPVVIGYMGSLTHQPDMARIEPALVEIAQRYGTRVAFHFWGLEPPRALAACATVTWAAVEVRDYAEFARFWLAQTCDIALAPLEDNFFNRCKSAIKFLEYAALGVAGVYGRVAPYQAVIQDGVNGLLAERPAEWGAALTRLIDDPTLRWRLAHGAQATVQRAWRLADQAAQWLQVYAQVRAAPEIAVPPASQLELETVALQRRLEAVEQELEILNANPIYRLTPPHTGRARVLAALLQAQQLQQQQGWGAAFQHVRAEIGLQWQAAWQQRGRTTR